MALGSLSLAVYLVSNSLAVGQPCLEYTGFFGTNLGWLLMECEKLG